MKTRMPQNQHYVPRFLLRNFAKRRKDDFYVFVYDKHKEVDNVFNSNINRVSSEGGFYDLQTNAETLSIEPMLSDLETSASVIIGKLIESRNLRSLDRSDRATLALFLSVQLLRTKQYRLIFNHLVDSYTERLRSMGCGEDDIKKVIQPPPDDVDGTKFFAIKSILDAHKRVPHFMNKVWILCETTKGCRFFISDNPITFDNHHDFGPYGNIGLAVRGIEIYLPISTTLCLGLICPTLADEFAEAYRRIVHLDNLLGRKRVDRRPGNLKQKRAFLEEFMSGQTMKMPKENVEKLNSLQVAYSSRFVYCEKDHFDLVRRMIRDDPKYREGRKPTLE
ncbi:MAG: DUF4238 domain-containing protein [Actinobacteria bacterium]|nr:DUF4238 domain-containing protein [Actinomycetota bacterium]